MQERGCWALRQIAVGGAAPQAIVLEAGGAAAVIAAMTKHADAAAVVQHGQSAAWAGPQLGSCASSGRAWRLWAPSHCLGCLNCRLESRRFHCLWPSRFPTPWGRASSSCATALPRSRPTSSLFI